MKNIRLTISTLLLIFTVSAVSAFAGNVNVKNNRALAKVKQNLSAKLKADLVSENVSVKFTDVVENAVGSNQVELKGEALAVLPSENTELPFKFEATVNSAGEIVNKIEYAFVESAYAPSSDEEVLMKHLLKKIAADYKTENVVIAIDGFDAQSNESAQKEFKGLAEIRVGEVEWKRIDFDVVLSADNNAEKVSYQFRK